MNTAAVATTLARKRKSHQITIQCVGGGVNGSDINNIKSTTLFHHLINKSLFALPIKGSRRQHIEIHVLDQIRMPIEQREISANKQRREGKFDKIASYRFLITFFVPFSF